MSNRRNPVEGPKPGSSDDRVLIALQQADHDLSVDELVQLTRCHRKQVGSVIFRLRWYYRYIIDVDDSEGFNRYRLSGRLPVTGEQQLHPSLGGTLLITGLRINPRGVLVEVSDRAGSTWNLLLEKDANEKTDTKPNGQLDVITKGSQQPPNPPPPPKGQDAPPHPPAPAYEPNERLIGNLEKAQTIYAARTRRFIDSLGQDDE